jgi:hypothetical protein
MSTTPTRTAVAGRFQSKTGEDLSGLNTPFKFILLVNPLKIKLRNVYSGRLAHAIYNVRDA